MKKRTGLYGVYFITLVMLLLIFLALRTTANPPVEVYSYKTLLDDIVSDSITKIDVTGDFSGDAQVYMKDGKVHETYIPNIQSFEKYLRENANEKMDYTMMRPSNLDGIISTVIQIVFFLGTIIVLIVFVQHFQGGGGGGRGAMSFGRSKAKLFTEDKIKVTFDNVAGLKEERADLEELVDFMKHPGKYVEIGAKVPKGVLLVGPPGTGKTLLAKAVAGEAGVPFFTISGSDFVELYVGVGASRVRDLFENAKKNAPCLVFIDEIDAVGRRRGAGLGGGHDEREQTLNQLLVEMDGFGDNEGVIIIAATNRPDILDPALLRPGRFDRKIAVTAPDVEGREGILQIHAKGKKIAADVDFNVIARSTPGFTGADIQNLLNEAALLSARDGKTEISMDEIRRAYIRVSVGTERPSRKHNKRDRISTAYHEIGHALMHEILDELDPVHIVSIIQTGRAGGYLMPIPNEDILFYRKRYMEQEIISFLGGRAAELVKCNDESSGASNDIQRATAMARNMVTKFGMSEKLGPIQFGDDNDEVFIGRDLAHTRNYSETVATLIDEEVKRIIDHASSEAIRLIKENDEAVEKATKLLLEKEKITGDEFRAILGRDPIETTDTIAFLTEKESKEEIKPLPGELM